MKTIIWYWEIN